MHTSQSSSLTQSLGRILTIIINYYYYYVKLIQFLSLTGHQMTPCNAPTQRLESSYAEVLDMYNECSDGVRTIFSERGNYFWVM